MTTTSAGVKYPRHGPTLEVDEGKMHPRGKQRTRTSGHPGAIPGSVETSWKVPKEINQDELNARAVQEDALLELELGEDIGAAMGKMQDIGPPAI